MHRSVPAGCALIIAVFALAGCATTKGPPPEFGPRLTGETAARLPFLRDGITTEEEIVARLGSPAGRLQEYRTWFYTFVQTEDGGLRQSAVHYGSLLGVPEERDDQRYRFQLVLTFDANGRLVRHTLVEKPEMPYQ